MSECRENRRREGPVFLMGVNEITCAVKPCVLKVKNALVKRVQSSLSVIVLTIMMSRILSPILNLI
jgi:hypothetical protein